MRRTGLSASAELLVYYDMYPMSQKVDHFYFCNNLSKVDNFPIVFTVKFRKELWTKLELKLPPPLKSVAALPCKK